MSRPYSLSRRKDAAAPGALRAAVRALALAAPAILAAPLTLAPVAAGLSGFSAFAQNAPVQSAPAQSAPAPSPPPVSPPPASPAQAPAAANSAGATKAPDGAGAPAAVPPAAAPADKAPSEAAKAAPPTNGSVVKPADPAPSGDASTAVALDLVARPVVVIRGQATWEEGYKSVQDSLEKARAGARRGGLAENGRPLVAFLETDDNGFKYEAMIPVAAPSGEAARPDLGDARLSVTPSGKAYRFQHRGAYEDVDSTYEAIAAWLDEKGLEARNIFMEEFVNDPKGADDAGLALDIYVFVK